MNASFSNMDIDEDIGHGMDIGQGTSSTGNSNDAENVDAGSHESDQAKEKTNVWRTSAYNLILKNLIIFFC